VATVKIEEDFPVRLNDHEVFNSHLTNSIEMSTGIEQPISSLNRISNIDKYKSGD